MNIFENGFFHSNTDSLAFLLVYNTKCFGRWSALHRELKKLVYLRRAWTRMKQVGADMNILAQERRGHHF